MLPLLAFSAVAGASAKEWAAVDDTSASTVIGVGAQSDTRAVVGAANNGVGALVERYDGDVFNKEMADGAGLLMDAAVSTTYTVATSMLPIIVSKDDKTYETSESLGAVSQDAHVENDIIYVVGSLVVPQAEGVPETPNGVGRSVDGGTTWDVSNIDVGYSRYGAFPSENVWYVSAGMWASSDEEVSKRNDHAHPTDFKNEHKRSIDSFALSSRIDVGGGSSGAVHYKDIGHYKKFTGGANETETGWWGTISKTTDGGKTWSKVFESDPVNDYYYFNSISCSSETHCVAVAEGDNADGSAFVGAFVTFDGGASWTNTLTPDSIPDNTMSIMASAWVSDDEGWLGAVGKSKTQLEAVFFHTTDGGKTYNVGQTLTNCFPMDMTFGSTVGYATCLNSAGSAGYVAMYV